MKGTAIDNANSGATLPPERSGSAGEAAPDMPPISPRIHLSRWITGVIGLVLVAMFLHLLITNPNWEWDVVGKYLFAPVVMEGLLLTLYLTFASTALGLVLGVITAYMRLSGNPVLRVAASLYIWFIRAIPALVLLLLIFFLGALLPTISLGIPFGPSFVSWQTNELISRSSAAVVGLGLYLGAYTGEIFRGGVLAVSKGQLEAARALGMTDGLLMRRVVAPQTIRVIIPSLANEIVTMFKSTSLVTVIGATELLTTVQLIYARTFEVIPLLLVACLWYLLIVSIAMLGQRQLEKHFGRGFSATQRRTSRRLKLRTGTAGAA